MNNSQKIILSERISNRISGTKILLGISLFLSSCALIICLFSQVINRPKVVYVKSQELIYGYVGMKEAHNKFKEKVQEWQSGKQSLEEDYKKALVSYKEETSLSEGRNKIEKQQRVKTLGENLESYVQSINTKAKEEDEKLTQSVLNQINSFIEDYGRKKGYKIIIGTTLSGNLLYGEESLDITSEVLSALNKSYLNK